VRLIGLLLVGIVAAIALWLVFLNPKLGGDQLEPVASPPALAPPANTETQNEMADEAKTAQAAAKAKAAKAAALAAQRALEAAQADALEQNMTSAQNRLNEDYAAQVGDTRPASSASGNMSTSPDGNSL
jgi:hypothetical protein